MQNSRTSLSNAGRLAVAACLALLLGTNQPVGATTYVMPTDDELMDRADLIVIGTVEGKQAANGVRGPATDHQIRVERVLKGYVLASDLLVRVPGGVSEEGYLVRMHGSPELDVGQRVMLFLNPHDGQFRVVDLELGVFRERGIGTMRTAVRRLAGTEVALTIDPKAEQRAHSHKPRAFDDFAQWISDRAAGIQRAPDYFLDEAPGLVGTEQAFNHVQFDCGPGGPNNAFARRAQFDNGQTVTYRAFNVGDPGIPGGGFTQIQRGLQAWNQVSASTVNLRYGGTTGSNLGGGGVDDFDGTDRVILNDPRNVIDGSFNGSGTLAVTSIIASCNQVGTFANGTFISILDADIVFQDGLDTNFYPFVLDPALAFERIFTHEAGHGIGMAHSCSGSCAGSAGDAIMRANYVDSTLGRTLGSDDRQGIRFLYPGATGGNTPTAPSNLEATALSISTIGLTWADNSSGETGFLLQERAIASTEWSDLAVLAANSTSVVVESIPEATARVYRIRANGSSNNSAFSNEAQATTFGSIGTCVEDANTGCLSNGRFEVTARWATTAPSSGQGNFSDLTSDTGTFWFFDEDNVEMVVKVLDACGPPFNSFWVFAGGLTNVEVELVVIDRETGLARTYFNPQGTAFNPIQDITAFETCP